jgi:membrane associated rhomboid family serine protease
MPSEIERTPTASASRPRTIVAMLLCVLGFALTLYVFYPGVMNYDSRYVHSYIGQNPLGDPWRVAPCR